MREASRPVSWLSDVVYTVMLVDIGFAGHDVKYVAVGIDAFAELAASLGVKAIALPALGCGANLYPRGIALSSALRACQRHAHLLAEAGGGGGACVVVDLVVLEPALCDMWAQLMDRDSQLVRAT